MIFLELLFPEEYNARIVIPAVIAYGSIAGAVGVPLVLKKRALFGDAIGHASLPGVVLAFLFGFFFWGSGKEMALLLTGGAIAGFAGVFFLQQLHNKTKLKEDALIAILLSFSFGIGVVLLSFSQSLSGGDQAGLDHFIYGSIATIRLIEAKILIGCSLVLWLCFLATMKEIKITVFDFVYAEASGFNTKKINLYFLILSVLVVIVGLPTVGLVLGVALLIIPVASAQRWSNNYNKIVFISSMFGATSAWVGASLSNYFLNLPAGAIIVITSFFLYLCSLIFGIRNGFLVCFSKKNKLQTKIDIDHVLRSMWELKERGYEQVSVTNLLSSRQWKANEMYRAVKRTISKGYIKKNGDVYYFSKKGLLQSENIVKRHRLWEAYLVKFVDIDPTHVDRDADQTEHVIGSEIIDLLEKKLGTTSGDIIKSAHPIRDYEE